MEDRELLELAAKAAGLDFCFGRAVADLGTEVPVANGKIWNPLGDDGDALRLAVKLSISIDVSGMFVHADCRRCKYDIGFFEENSARHCGDMMQAARRAIVRAAAEIGRLMP